jgi:hypothetical protein
MALGWVGFRWRSGTSTGSRTPDAEEYRDWRFGFSPSLKSKWREKY